MKKSICNHPFVLSLKNNRGDFGIKQLAFTVAVVMLIGVAVQFLSGGWLTARIEDVWTWLWEDVIQSWLS